MKKLLCLLLCTSPTWARPDLDKLLQQLTLDEKISMLGGVDSFYTRAIPRLGIPALKMADGPMGVRNYGLSTAYPAPCCLAASWDVNMARRLGAAMAQDCRAAGAHVLLAPGMNLYRTPLNGRNFEYLGEDPYLAGRMAVALVRGIQGQRVMATAKHFIANNSEYGRMDHSSNMDERTMRELYLPAFEACVKEGRVAALMDAYNPVNGTYMTENGALNLGIARNEWGFDGIIMSDWGATHNGLAALKGGLDLEMPAAEFMHARLVREALASGQISQKFLDDKVRRLLRKTMEFGYFEKPIEDLTLPKYSQIGRQVALEAAQGGMVLLRNQGGLLPLQRQRDRLVLVLGPNAYPAVPGGGGSSEVKPYRAISFLEGISDVAGPGVRVVHIPDAVDLDALDFPFDGGSLRGEYFHNTELKGQPALVRQDQSINFRMNNGSYTPDGPSDNFSVRWTGTFTPPRDDEYRFCALSDDGVRLWVDDQPVINNWTSHGDKLDLGAVQLRGGQPHRIRLEYFEETGSATLRFGVVGVNSALPSSVRKLAAQASSVIYCGGFSPSTEGEGVDRPFGLPPSQVRAIRQLTALNRRTTVVLTGGGNVDGEGWMEGVAGLIHAWYPGQEGGTALGQLIWGDVSPSGKLPASFERRLSDNPAYANYYPQNHDKQVEYREGLFLGYRHFDRSPVKPGFPFGYGLSYTRFAYSDLRLTSKAASFTIQNVGSRRGAEVAQLYVSDGHAPLPRPVKELKGFAKVDLAPGQSRRVTLPLNRRSFAYWDPARHDWTVAPGKFTVLVGASSVDIRLQGRLDYR